MRNRLASVAACAVVVIAGAVGGINAAPAPQGPAPAAPKDTAALRAQFKSWMPQTKELLVKDADHLLTLQQPLQIAEGIQRFLAPR